MTHRFVLSPAARKDLEQIWEYTEDHWGVVQAESYLHELQRAIRRAADNPLIGRQCDDIRPGYRKLLTGSHVIFYRLNAEGTLDVVRILHQRMDIDRHV